MQPTIYNIKYYSGDEFTMTIFPKNSSGEFIPVGSADSVYFRLASARGTNPSWATNGEAVTTQLINGGPYCIKVTMTSAVGQQIRNGYVYDIGYYMSGKRTTVLTGSFQIMDEVNP